MGATTSTPGSRFALSASASANPRIWLYVRGLIGSFVSRNSAGRTLPPSKETFQLAVFQHAAVLLAQDGQQHLVLQLGA